MDRIFMAKFKFPQKWNNTNSGTGDDVDEGNLFGGGAGVTTNMTGAGGNYSSHYLDTRNNNWQYVRRILFRWKGSIYKLVWTDLILWLVLYYGLRLFYLYGLGDSNKREFEKYVIYCRDVGSYVPLSFVLGFYVTTVVNRWWRTWELIPTPDNLAFYVTAYIQGSDERGRMIRRTIMRYVILGISYSMTLFSINVRKRFNTLEDFVSFGLLEEDEIPIIRKMAEKTQKVYWLPLVWAGTMTATARKEGRVENDLAMKTILDEIVKLRLLCAKCSSMVMVNVPLSYSQVVTWAVYGFFAACLIGRQFVAGDSDIYVPVFTILQFLVYMGWLKVAEALINPFGEDDDDFQLLTLIERGLERAYAVVDELHAEHPQLVKDQYFDIVLPELTVTRDGHDLEGSMPDITRTFNGSVCGADGGGVGGIFASAAPRGSTDLISSSTQKKRNRWRKVSLLQRVVNAGSSIPFGSYTSAPVPDSVSGIDVEDERRSSGVQSRMVDSKEKKGKLIRWGKLKIPVKSSEGSRDDYGDPNSALSAGGLPAAQMHHHCSALQLHEGRASSRLSFSRASQDDVSALAERRSLLSIPSRAATPNPTTPVVAIAVATTPVGEMRHQPLSLEIPQHHVTPPVCRRTPTQ